MTTCTYRSCDEPAVRRLEQSIGGGAWHGCNRHWPAMHDALLIGMPGATTGTAWIDITVLRPAKETAA